VTAHKTNTNSEQHSVAERINARFGELTSTEKRIARILLADYPVAGLNTVHSLGASASVSAASVVRFTKSLGFAGFRDFQKSLRVEMRAREDSTLSQARASESPSASVLSQTPVDPVTHSLRTLMQETTQTFESLRRHEFDALVDLLADTDKHIYACGGQFSDVLARHLVSQMSLFRSRASMVPADPLQRANALLGANASAQAWIFFDFRRYAKDLEALATLAHNNGARVVLVTDRWLSPIASVADIVLTCRVEALGPSDTLVPGLTLVEVLCERAVEKLDNRGLEHLSSVEPLRSELPPHSQY
jgi:DNA-binding MurR/RpiR family transcriptional regulator